MELKESRRFETLNGNWVTKTYSGTRFFPINSHERACSMFCIFIYSPSVFEISLWPKLDVASQSRFRVLFPLPFFFFFVFFGRPTVNDSVSRYE